MKKFQFWAKVISLSIIIIAAIAYLFYIGGVNFLTATPYSKGVFYWYALVLHLVIMLICVLYLVDKIRLWKSK
jgi:preprotein translocase subunit SecY